MSERITTRSIILSRVAYGEADWIVTVFSREHGRLSGIARAGRKSLKRFGSGLEPGAVTMISYTLRPHAALVNLEESHVVFSTTGMMCSLERIEALAKAVRIAQSFLKEHQAAPEKFDLMERYLTLLSLCDPTEAQQLGFQLKWISYAGYEPALLHCTTCGGDIQGDVAFSPQQGGALCSACSHSQRAPTVLTSSIRDAMTRLLQDPLGTSCEARDARAIASLVTTYTQHILGDLRGERR